MFEFIIRKTYVHCLRYRTYAIRFAIGAFVTEMLSAGASADDLAPCHKITGEIGWLQGRGIEKSLLAITTT